MNSHYKTLLAVLSINTVIMFLLTFALIDTLGHFHVNINRIYMALLMVAPMGLIMLVAMRSMFENRKVNAILYALFGGLFVIVFVLMRTQTPVGDDQFLRSMIPHHSSAIVMCERASITDPEITELCVEIVETQKEEIAQMEAILARR